MKKTFRIFFVVPLILLVFFIVYNLVLLSKFSYVNPRSVSVKNIVETDNYITFDVETKGSNFFEITGKEIDMRIDDKKYISCNLTRKIKLVNKDKEDDLIFSFTVNKESIVNDNLCSQIYYGFGNNKQLIWEKAQ